MIDKSDDNHWIWHIIYYNPDDPDLLVPKQSGLGYTFNFANKISWLITLSLLFVIISARVINNRKKQRIKE